MAKVTGQVQVGSFPPLLPEGSFLVPKIITFGGNAGVWKAEFNEGVLGLTSEIQYITPTAGPNGIPVPGTWPAPGQLFDPRSKVQHINFHPDPVTTIAGTNDAAIQAWASQAPDGTCFMPFHEANLPVDGITGPQTQQLDQHLLPLIHALNPTYKYGRGLATYTVVHRGQDPSPWITPGMDFYGMDGYQHLDATLTPDGCFGTLLTAILAAQPGAEVRIIETNTALDISAWLNGVVDYVFANRHISMMQTFFAPAGATSGGLPWNSSYVPILNQISHRLGAS